MDDQQLFRGGSLFDGSAAPQSGLGVLVCGGTVEHIAPVAEFDGFSGMIVDTVDAILTLRISSKTSRLISSYSLPASETRNRQIQR